MGAFGSTQLREEAMKLLLCLISLAVSRSCGAETAPLDKKDAATAYSVAHTNKWADDMLKQGMDELKKSVGPVVLPSQNIDFDVAVLWENVKGGLNLTSGKLENIFNIHRIGETILKLENERVVAKVKLGVENIKGSYGISFRFGHLHDAGKVSVSIETVQLGVEANQFFSPTQGSTNILNLDLNLHVKIYLGKINVYVNMGGAANMFQKQLKDQVERPVRGFLPSVVKKHRGDVLTKIGDITDVAATAYREYGDQI